MRFAFALRYLALFLGVVAPLLSGSWSLLDALGAADATTQQVSLFGVAFLTGPKSQVEFKLKASLSLIVLALTLTNEAITVGLPLKRLRDFRRKYLDSNYSDEWEGLVGKDCRLNVMFLRRRFYTLWLPFFEWTWSKNFGPPNHEDANVWLFKWQGVAGEAVRHREVKSAYFTEQPAAWGLPYYLMPFQVNRTRRVKGIISVPILRKSDGASPAFKCVGVINIDAMTDEAAALLKRNESELGSYFVEFGILLGDLSL